MLETIFNQSIYGEEKNQPPNPILMRLMATDIGPMSMVDCWACRSRHSEIETLVIDAVPMLLCSRCALHPIRKGSHLSQVLWVRYGFDREKFNAALVRKSLGNQPKDILDDLFEGQETEQVIANSNRLMRIGYLRIREKRRRGVLAEKIDAAMEIAEVFVHEWNNLRGPSWARLNLISQDAF